MKLTRRRRLMALVLRVFPPFRETASIVRAVFDGDTARVLVLSTPSGLERMILDASIPANAPTLPPAEAPRPTAEELSRIFELHGQVNCGPPLAPGEP